MVHCTVPVAAPPETVAAALTEPWLVRASLAPLGISVDPAVDGHWLAGQELSVRCRVARFRLRLAAATERGGIAGGRLLEVSACVEPAGVGSSLTYTIRCGLPAGRLLSRALDALVSGARQRAEGLVDAPVVVGTALIAGRTVLAAQRTRPPATAGRWEFPGGRVEAGEDERTAVARECREELAVDVVVGARLGQDIVLHNGWLLRVYRAELAGDTQPTATEHRAVRWVSAEQLAELDWLDADRVLLPQLTALLQPS